MFYKRFTGHDFLQVVFILVKISPKRPKMASVRYFGGLWITASRSNFCMLTEDKNMYYIYQPQDVLTFCI